MIEVGFSQLLNASPAALPTGTRSDAIAPAAAPSANGVTSEATPKVRSIARISRGLRTPERSAYAAPRRITPTRAMNRGMASVDATEPRNTGYAVHVTVITKINHTWLASHTGPIAWWA